MTLRAKKEDREKREDECGRVEQEVIYNTYLKTTYITYIVYIVHTTYIYLINVHMHIHIHIHIAHICVYRLCLILILRLSSVMLCNYRIFVNVLLHTLYIMHIRMEHMMHRST